MIGCIGIQMCVWLACPEGDDAPDRIVRRHADGYAIPGNHFDAEAAHPAAQLGQHFVAGVALHAIQTAAMDRHHRALHVNEIVLAQTASNPFFATNIVPRQRRPRPPSGAATRSTRARWYRPRTVELADAAHQIVRFSGCSECSTGRIAYSEAYKSLTAC